MKRSVYVACAVACLLLGVFTTGAALAQKSGGTLRVHFFDSPGGMSIHEEATIAAEGPMMGVFNNLVMFKQDVPQTSLKTVVPDLAESWSYSDDKTKLTFKLHQGVKWHDGKPFTAKDVKCTWDLLTERTTDRLRINPRKAWYHNLKEVTVNGDYEVTFHLGRPQPSMLALLASGFSPVYPCHVPAREMRAKPIGTGPFKFVEFKPNESIKVVRNPDYWKKGKPYLDGIDYTIIRGNSTGMLAFVAGKFDLTSPYFFQVPVLNDIKSQMPQAICELVPSNVQRNVLINRAAPPFDKPEMRRAVALVLDRKAFIDTLTQGKGDIGAVMLAPPEGIWGMPPDMVRQLPGYSPDVAKSRAEARQIVEKLGYGPNNRLKLKVSTRNIPPYRDPAVILIDQLKEIYIDAELELVETPNWVPKVMRKDYAIGLNLTGNGMDDPDQTFYENYTCGAEGNYDGYCNPEIDKLIEAQSTEENQEKRKLMVWDIERKLAEDVARPVLYHNRSGSCWYPHLKNFRLMVNSIYNGNRFEDIWLDK